MIGLAEYELKKRGIGAQFVAAKNARLRKATSNLFRHVNGAKDHLIDARQFNQVIAIDCVTLTADVEGMITYEALVDETLKFGLMPTVVPEFKTITVGGATTGIGLEASSFKYGFVHETIQEMDILLPTGQTITCSKNRNQDLFYGFPNSYATLGYALRLRIQIVPVKPYVAVQHRRFGDFDAYFAAMKQTCNEPVDFVDGTIFSANEMYITTGTFADTAPALSDYSYMRIYYKSIRQKTQDFMTTRNFLWRWDTDWYWGSRKFGAENPFVRFLLGRKRLRSSFYWKLRSQLNKAHFWKLLEPIAKYETVVQDVDIPIENAAEFMRFQSEQIAITPVWACPVNAFRKDVQYPLYAMDPQKTYVNLGFWDIVPTKCEPGHYNRLVENKVTELGGRKILYSDSYYPADEFYDLYGGETYARLKDKYDPHHTFKSLYQACVARA